MTPEIANVLIAVAANLAVVILAVALWLAWRVYTTKEQRIAVRSMVEAAEQQFAGNQERRQWALAQLTAMFPKLSPELMSALLEAAVYEMHVEREEIEIPRRWIEQGESTPL